MILAAGRGGRITVSAMLEGEQAVVTVIDDAGGVSAAAADQLFKPLFTTKSFGVGLGLPAVEKILEHHGGGIRIESKLGEGAAFTAWFPVEPAEAVAA